MGDTRLRAWGEGGGEMSLSLTHDFLTVQSEFLAQLNLTLFLFTYPK